MPRGRKKICKRSFLKDGSVAVSNLKHMDTILSYSEVSSRKQFIGKLSHSSPRRSSQITNYFHPIRYLYPSTDLDNNQEVDEFYPIEAADNVENTTAFTSSAAPVVIVSDSGPTIVTSDSEFFTSDLNRKVILDISGSCKQLQSVTQNIDLRLTEKVETSCKNSKITENVSSSPPENFKHALPCIWNVGSSVEIPTTISSNSSAKIMLQVGEDNPKSDVLNFPQDAHQSIPITEIPSTPKSIFRNKNVELSPSTALSFLHITTPGKNTKTHRKVVKNISHVADVFKPNFSNYQNSLNKASCNKKLTDYFPIRRSVRKTKKEVLAEMQKSIEEAIMSGKEDGLIVQNFEGKGRGVVTTRGFSKGEFVVEYAGELITISEAKIRENVYAQDENIGCYMYYFKYKNEKYCIDATAESGRLGRLVNHSRNGNLVTKTLCVKNHPHLIFIAREDIPEGTEILYDYGDRSKESLKYHPWLTK